MMEREGNIVTAKSSRATCGGIAEKSVKKFDFKLFCIWIFIKMTK